MIRQTYTTSGDMPEIIVKSRGDLVVQGADAREVTLESYSPHSFEVHKDGDRFQIEFMRDGFLWVPRGSKVVIERVAGDATIEGLHDELSLQKIGGELSLNQIETAVIDHVGGDCRIAEVNGTLDIHKVGGDFSGRNVLRCTLVEKVGGDFWLQSSGFPVNTHAGGDLRVGFTSIEEGSSDLSAGGDVWVFLPPEASLNLKVHSGGEEIAVNVAGHPSTFGQRDFETTLGDGKAALSISAGGQVTISDQPWQLDILGDFQQQIDLHLGDLETKLRSKLDEVGDIVDVQTRRAERRMEEAFRHIDRKTAQSLKHYGSSRGNFSFMVDTNAHPAPASEPVTSDERLLILKMVEAKKITPEQAEILFKALDGK